MTKLTRFAHLQTGVGTAITSSTYFGPFEDVEESDTFVERVRSEYRKLGTASTMAITIIDGVPEGRGVLKPDSFYGFLKAIMD